MHLTTGDNGPYTLTADPGGHGQLYVGEDGSGRAVVAKQLAPDAMARVRLLAEARIDGVIPVLDELEIDGEPAVVLPRVKGDLGDWLYGLSAQTPGARELRLLLGRMARLAEALAEVHALGPGEWVHRDVKPENVLLDEQGDVWLSDFDGLGRGSQVRHSVLGTPRWAPLDQLLAGAAPLDPTWDTASLCGMLFVGLTGRHPAHVDDPRALLTARGREVWQRVQRIQQADEAGVAEHYQALLEARKGLDVFDVLDPAAPAAPGETDREAVTAALASWCSALSPAARSAVTGQLWQLLRSGLSTRPSERLEARVLADRLRALEQQALPSSKPPPPPPRRQPRVGARPPARSRRRGSSRYGVAMWLLAAVMVASVVASMPRWAIYQGSHRAAELPSDVTVAIPGGIALVSGKEVLVEPFIVDRTERTNADWRSCQFAGECRMRLLTGEDRHPVVGLTEEDAMALCEHFGGRLPRRGEWERLVGGGTYPWGDERPTCDRAVLASCEGGLQPVGQHPAGANRWGVLDLAGNAAEWVRANNPTETPWIMGGSARSEDWQLRNDAGNPFRGSVTYDMAGARCVYDR